MAKRLCFAGGGRGEVEGPEKKYAFMLLLAAILTCSDFFDVFYTQGYTRLIIQNGSLVVGWTGDLVSLPSIRAVLVDVWREEVTSPAPRSGCIMHGNGKAGGLMS